MMQLRGQPRPLVLAQGTEPSLGSAGSEWAGVPFELHRMRSFDLGTMCDAGPLSGELGLMVYLDGAVDIVASVRGAERRVRAEAGSAVLMSGDDRLQVRRVEGEATAMAFHLSPAWRARMTEEHGSRWLGCRGRLTPDARIHALAQAARNEVEHGTPSGTLYAQSLSLSLLGHALEAAPIDAVAALDAQRGLSAQQRERIERHVRERLGADHTLDELAALVGLRARQFSERFRRSFGTSPYRYVIELRLREAARRLREGQGEIVEIAIDVGFCSQSHFTGAFSRAFGITPRRYAIECGPRRTYV